MQYVKKEKKKIPKIFIIAALFVLFVLIIPKVSTCKVNAAEIENPYYFYHYDGYEDPEADIYIQMNGDGWTNDALEIRQTVFKWGDNYIMTIMRENSFYIVHVWHNGEYYEEINRASMSYINVNGSKQACFIIYIMYGQIRICDIDGNILYYWEIFGSIEPMEDIGLAKDKTFLYSDYLRNSQFLPFSLHDVSLSDLNIYALNVPYDTNYSSGYIRGYEKGNVDGIQTGYNRGYENGYQEGYDEGGQRGYENGYKNGYDEGHFLGNEEGYNRGHQDGDAVGYNRGRQEGYQEGYQEGGSKTLEDLGLFAWMTSLFAALGGFLNIRLGVVSIGQMLFFPLAISLCWAIIKMMRGGGE